jgi:exopolysaccharide biosynthesis polyprenyl glycosylphosphotransferase
MATPKAKEQRPPRTGDPSARGQPQGAAGALRPLTLAGPSLPARRHLLERLLAPRGFTRLVPAVDLLMLLVALGVGLWLAGRGLSGVEVLGAALYPPLALACLVSRGAYRTRLSLSFFDGLGTTIGALSLAAMALITAGILLGPTGPTAGDALVRVWLVATGLVVASRAALTQLQTYARGTLRVQTPAAIVGAGLVGHQIAKGLERRPETGLRPIGFIDSDPKLVPPAKLPVLGTPAQLEQVVKEHGIQHVILAFSQSTDESLLQLVHHCNELEVQVSVVPRLFDSMTSRIRMDRLGGLPLLELSVIDPKGWQFALKHAADRVLALLAVVFLSPLLLALAIGVKLSSPGPVLFRQHRVGRDGASFGMLKFRSMAVTGEEPRAFALGPDLAPGGVEGADRRTAFGRLLRRTSLDELPQLLNVLRGEMSLVGPRPERPEFVALFKDDVRRYAERHRVRAGLTGWAQVHGLRGQTSVTERAEWDNYYIQNWSLWLDAKILAMTCWVALRGGGE